MFCWKWGLEGRNVLKLLYEMSEMVRVGAYSGLHFVVCTNIRYADTYYIGLVVYLEVP